MVKTRRLNAFAVSLILFLCVASGANLFAQNIVDTSKPLDESALFGGDSDLVTVVDTATASAGTIQLVADTKKYPVFLVEGDANTGLVGDFTPHGAGSSDEQSLFGTANLNGVSLSFIPAEDITFNISTDATVKPSGIEDLTASAYANIRDSEFTRLYAAISYRYNLSESATSLTASTEGFSLDELFVDTAIDRKVFFRLGKQRVSWGVGYWFKPADVLSLAAIDPDNPTASREGPFAFKTDMPFGLNHATLYIVPPTTGDPAQFAIAERTDLVVGGFELSLAGFYRTDMEYKPRAIFMFSGALGNFDLYGENVAAWGADRAYVREASGGGYETYRVENQLVFQSTLGVKYSWESSDGLGVDFHVQGYYNGLGYADSSILRDNAAVNAILAAEGETPSSALRSRLRSGSGMYYLGANAYLSGRWGEGKKLTKSSLGGYVLLNFSDWSTRFKPTWTLSSGSGGSSLDMSISALTSLGPTLSEYAPRGNMITPALSVKIMKTVTLAASAPLYFDSAFSLTKANLDFSLYWNIISFD